MSFLIPQPLQGFPSALSNALISNGPYQDECSSQFSFAKTTTAFFQEAIIHSKPGSVLCIYRKKFNPNPQVLENEKLVVHFISIDGDRGGGEAV